MSFLRDMFRGYKFNNANQGGNLRSMTQGYLNNATGGQSQQQAKAPWYSGGNEGFSGSAPKAPSMNMGGNMGGGMGGGAQSNPMGSGLSDADIAELGNKLAMARTGNARLEAKNTSNPDVNKYFQDVNDVNNPLSGVDLRIARNSINNRRNDIAVGEVEPYDIADQFGVVFSPEQRKNQRAAAAGIYDPMLEDVNARIEYEMEQQKEADKTNRAGLFAGLDDFTVRQITNLTDGFDNLDTTKAYRRLGSAVGAIMAVDANTTNPADHQSIISAYAKALDPDSVVREGEYETVRKYSQSLVDKFGGQINNALKGTGFLSPEAIMALQDATKKRYDAMKSQTDEYAKRVTQTINSRFGQNFSPEELFTDYGVSTGGGGGGEIIEYNGQRYELQPDGSAVLMDFNKVGGGTNTASKVGSLQDAMKRIARNESGGNYSALGPVVQSGMYKGERAIGKYQVMPGNIPSWSREVLGYTITPEQFKNNPKLQDTIAAAKLSEYYRKYGNWSDAASVWFTGQPLSKGKYLADVLGTTGQQYVDNFNA